MHHYGQQIADKALCHCASWHDWPNGCALYLVLGVCTSRGRTQDVLERTGDSQSMRQARTRTHQDRSKIRLNNDTSQTKSCITPNPDEHRPQHACMSGRTERCSLATSRAEGGWRMHTAQDTANMNTTERSIHCNFVRPGRCRPRAAAVSSETERDRDKISRDDHNRDGVAGKGSL